MKNTAVISTIEEALAALGVTGNSLSDEQKEALNTRGYIVLENVLTSERLVKLRQLFDSSVTAQLAIGTSEKETGTRHIKDLHRTDEFWPVCIHPQVLAAAFHVLKRRFVASVPHGREPLQGFGRQGLHMDWRTEAHAGVNYVATGICLLDDFTPGNGATRVAPGSHRSSKRPSREIADPGFVHPNQVIVAAPAGSVLMFNGHLLHSGTENSSGLRRRTLQFSFTAHEVRGWVNGEEERAAVADPAVRFIFDW